MSEAPRDSRPDARPGAKSIILASQSRFRRAVLAHAGISFAVEAAAIDEAEVRAGCRAAGEDARAAAMALAELKAVRISRRHPDALVIGADQMLECDGAWFEKPVDRDSARTSLLALRGKTHQLVTAVCVAQAGQRIWHHAESAHLTMRQFSDGFLESYLDAAGDDTLLTVGAYQVEGLGIQLFERVEGDHSTILGLPLLPLLDFLRGHGAVPR